MKQLMSFAIALILVGAATPALADTSASLQVEIDGDAKFGGGTARTSQLSRQAAAKAKVKRTPVGLCFAPPNGNSMKTSMPRRAQRARTSCARTSTNRLN